MRKALITGITGQDGSYLTELLLERGYEVHGIIRKSSSFNTGRIDHLLTSEIEGKRLFTYYGDLTDSSNISRLLEKIQPDEIYNLAAQSHVKVSFEIPEYTTEVDAVGTLRFLDAIKEVGIQTKFYQASTSELFGKALEIPQKETTPFYPRSPYAVSKVYAYWIVVNYREAYGLFALNGILFNHESPRRGETFVTRKITSAVSKIAYGLQEKIQIGNIEAKRDWGYAPEYCEGMWLMMQQEKPDDYILATGKSYSVREFIELAFKEIGVKLNWIGPKHEEKGIVESIATNEHNIDIGHIRVGNTVVEISPQYYRPAEVDYLIGDPSKAYAKLGWKAHTDFDALVNIMMNYDLKRAKDLLIEH